MTTVLWYALGVVIFALGLIVSIAWHEAGHLTFAKLFGVRVTQYMVGFGKTIWSRRRGDTEYGVKAVPLGGYIRMIGMVPPAKDGRARFNTTAASPLGIARQIREQTRAGDRALVTDADEGRQFYQLHPFKRIVVMVAGPAQNLIFAVVLFAIAMMAIGIPAATTTIHDVSACIVPVAPSGQEQRTACVPADPATPAAQAGLKPGDRVTAVNGASIDSWSQFQSVIADSGGKTIRLTYVRAGDSHTVDVPIVATERPKYDANGNPDGAAVIGFLGVSPDEVYVRQGIGSAFVQTGNFIVAASKAVARIPQRIPAVWNAIVHPSQNDPNRPMGIIGAGRIGGEILAQPWPVKAKISWVLNLLAGFNMSLFLLNLLPLLPLDGGHVLGAVIDWIRRGWAKIRRRSRPREFDVAALMPVAYVVVLLFIGLSLLTAVADIVNPVRLFG
ncbi:MAG: zinc metalloprotease [Actinobacteria bacterium 69-20]|nr:MAG: zinc metalloprotease [Actinobacteria bacterium 69-20]